MQDLLQERRDFSGLLAVFTSVVEDEDIVESEAADLRIEQKVVYRGLASCVLPIGNHTFADVEDFGKFGLRDA